MQAASREFERKDLYQGLVVLVRMFARYRAEMIVVISKCNTCEYQAAVKVREVFGFDMRYYFWRLWLVIQVVTERKAGICGAFIGNKGCVTIAGSTHS